MFLRPGEGGECEERLKELRGVVEGMFGLREGEGTREGVWRPHLGVGQAALTGSGREVGRLEEQVRKVVGLEWEARGLVVLRREADGRMSICEELRFGDPEGMDGVEGDELEDKTSQDPDWSRCFAFNDNSNDNEGTWSRFSEGDQIQSVPNTISISTYNTMAEPTAVPFSARLPIIITSLSSPTSPPKSALQILCLQETNDESLPIILNSPYIQQTYPYATHAPSSLLPSARNLVTLASQPFISTIVQFEARHKSALIIEFSLGEKGKTLLVANVHLTSGLTDKAVQAKKSQMNALSKFLMARRKNRKSQIIIAGDFNLTTSNRTIQKALSRGLITKETAMEVKTVIDLNVWEDAFLVSELNPDEGKHGDEAILDGEDASGSSMLGHGGNEIFAGEQGATFDRSTNPIAAQLDPPIDRNPQRYDRVLFLKGGKLSAERDGFEIFGFADEEGRVGSDHYGVRALLSVAGSESSPAASSRIALRNDAGSGGRGIAVIEDDTDFSTLLQPYLPAANDVAQREMAIDLLQSTLSRGAGLENLILAPLGSYLMNTYFANSDVDVLGIGSVSPAKFFEFAGRELRNLDSGNGENFKGVHFVNSLVSIVEVNVLGIKFDLQYCQAEELVRAYVSCIAKHIQNGHANKLQIPQHHASVQTPRPSLRQSSNLEPFTLLHQTPQHLPRLRLPPQHHPRHLILPPISSLSLPLPQIPRSLFREIRLPRRHPPPTTAQPSRKTHPSLHHKIRFRKPFHSNLSSYYRPYILHLLRFLQLEFRRSNRPASRTRQQNPLEISTRCDSYPGNPHTDRTT